MARAARRPAQAGDARATLPFGSPVAPGIPLDGCQALRKIAHDKLTCFRSGKGSGAQYHCRFYYEVSLRAGQRLRLETHPRALASASVTSRVGSIRRRLVRTERRPARRSVVGKGTLAGNRPLLFGARFDGTYELEFEFRSEEALHYFLCGRVEP